MPNEDDQFGDIAAQLKQTEAGEETADDENVVPEENIQSHAQESEQEVDQESESTQKPDNSDEDEPAFSFDETDMHGFYVRDETWDGVTRMRSSVMAACSIFDVSEFEGREFQDACLQVVANHGDEVALQILGERGIEADEERVQEVVEMLSGQAESD
ncbi:hypothetical protein ACFFQF_27330 [Haladaptatus pallidirubidus]|uniref:Uncharacterized protein n=1 Tax=Haladaptatus pallidirubidus TaxID=1008152 RepID=A0AAV3UIA9_9EURY|nr:hypothetical protein [Haladaptatus pallidirubidus]